MTFLQQFFDITAWLLLIYIVAAIILCITHWRADKTNIHLTQKIGKWIANINTIFACWFLAFTIFDVVRLKKMHEDLGLHDSFDSSTWVMIVSAMLFLIAIAVKKIRRSPFSMIGISIIIIVNFIIAYSNVAIVV